MRAIEVLKGEHTDIAEVIGFMQRLLREIVRTDELDGEVAYVILEYLERVADGSHQDHEELVMERLLERTAGDVRAFVEGLMAEHEVERVALDALRSALRDAVFGDPVSRDTFVVRGNAYAASLAEHAAWEDEFLLPLAERHLDRVDDGRLLAESRAVDAECFPGGHESAATLLERIRARCGPVVEPVLRAARLPRTVAPPRAPAAVAG